MIRKMLLIAEVAIDPSGLGDADLDALAQERLDAFRETVRPTQRWGITLYRFDHRRRKSDDSKRDGSECVLELANGNALRCPAYPAPCSYVRVTNREGQETSYWDRDEWERAPEEVMGAILGAAISDDEPASDTASRRRAGHRGAGGVVLGFR